MFLVQNRKIEHHHWILYTRISLYTKFQLKPTIFNLDQICWKRVFPVWNRKIALLRGSMVVTYYIKLFCTGADKHNGILMSLLLLVTETIIENRFCVFFTVLTQNNSKHNHFQVMLLLRKILSFLSCFRWYIVS